MKMTLHFHSADEFSLFLCSAAALDFRAPLPNGLLPTETYWPFLDHVSEVRVLDTTYTVKADTSESQHVDCGVVNYMLNEVQTKSGSIWIKGGETGIEAALECLKKLPKSIGLRIGWRTDYSSYVFRKK